MPNPDVVRGCSRSAPRQRRRGTHTGCTVRGRRSGRRPRRRGWWRGSGGQRHVVERRRVQRAGVVAVHEEAGVSRRPDRSRRAADRRPARAVRRDVAGHGAAGARELQPRRLCLRATGEKGGRTVAGRTGHELDAAIGLDVEDDVGGTRSQRLAQHHAGFGVGVGVLNRRDPRDDLRVAARSLIHVSERVSRAPDVGARPCDGEDAVGVRRAAGRPDAADVLGQPRARDRASGRRWRAATAAAGGRGERLHRGRGDHVRVARRRVRARHHFPVISRAAGERRSRRARVRCRAGRSRAAPARWRRRSWPTATCRDTRRSWWQTPPGSRSASASCWRGTQGFAGVGASGRLGAEIREADGVGPHRLEAVLDRAVDRRLCRCRHEVVVIALPGRPRSSTTRSSQAST